MDVIRLPEREVLHTFVQTELVCPARRFRRPRYRGAVMQEVCWRLDGGGEGGLTRVEHVYPTFSGPDGKLTVIGFPRWIEGRDRHALERRLRREWEEHARACAGADVVRTDLDDMGMSTRPELRP